MYKKLYNNYLIHYITQFLCSMSLNSDNFGSSPMIFQKGSTEVLGDVEFFPSNVFNLRYYPYYGKLRHVSDPIIHLRIPKNSIAFHSFLSPFLQTGKLLFPIGGCALFWSPVRDPATCSMQTKRQGHHQRFSNRPFPG